MQVTFQPYWKNIGFGGSFHCKSSILSVLLRVLHTPYRPSTYMEKGGYPFAPPPPPHLAHSLGGSRLKSHSCSRVVQQLTTVSQLLSVHQGVTGQGHDGAAYLWRDLQEKLGLLLGPKSLWKNATIRDHQTANHLDVINEWSCENGYARQTTAKFSQSAPPHFCSTRSKTCFRQDRHKMNRE